MLPNKVFPKNYELLSSWLIRLSHHNSTNLNVLSNYIFNNSKIFLNDIDRTLDENLIDGIAKYTNIENKIVRKLTLKEFLLTFSYDSLHFSHKWKWIIPSGAKYSIRTNGLQFCPKCLKKGIKEFYIFNRLSWNIICPKHNELLLNKCFKCNHQFSPNLKNFSDLFYICDYCQYDLTLYSSDEEISNEALELQTYLNNCLKENQVLNSDYKIVDDNIFELFYTVRIYINFILFIRRKEKIKILLEEEFKLNFKYLTNNQSSLLFDTLSSDKRMQVMDCVSKLLKIDLYIFENFLKISKITYKQFISSNEAIPKSKTIKFLLKNLKIKDVIQPKIKHLKNPTPKSIKEVDTLMYEIEEFL